MTKKEKDEIELNIEAKYVGRTEKEFLSIITYSECLYILDTKNNYCDEIKDLSLLKLVDIISKQQKEIEKFIRLAEVNLKDSQEFQDNMCNHRCIKNNEIWELQEENNKLKKQIDLMAESLTTDYHSKEWVIKNYEEKVK